LQWAVHESETRLIPILVEIMTDREESAAMGAALNSIREPDEIPTVEGRPPRTDFALQGRSPSQ
jgi:hypothetical protein